jgi:selenide,water dikinase
VTGFGLLGHLLEMLGGERAARLDFAALPLLTGVPALLQRGFRSTMHPANSSASHQLASAAGMDEDLLQILYDPQTSGGLLLGVAPARARMLLEALRRGAYPDAAIIGEVVERGAATPAAVLIS